MIDAHQHFWKYDPVRDAWIDDTMQVIRRDFLPGDLEPLLRENGMEGCVAVQADQSEQETGFLLRLAAAHPFIKGVVGWTDLQAPDIRERLATYAGQPLLKGFRHIVQAEPDPEFLLRKEVANGITALTEAGYTYDILVYARQLAAVEKFVEKFPATRLVIDHIAKPDIRNGEIILWEKQLRAIARFPHVFCKLSGIITEADWQQWQPEGIRPYLDVVLNAFGPQRLMFGSDWPVCLPAGSYAKVKSLITDYISSLTAAEQHAIMGANAVAFYNL